MCEKYNGYTNYATWGVSLVLDNSQGLHEYCLEIVQNMNEWEKKIQLTPSKLSAIAEAIEELVVDEIQYDNQDHMAQQLLMTALGQVNWEEIAEGYVETHNESLSLKE